MYTYCIQNTQLTLFQHWYSSKCYSKNTAHLNYWNEVSSPIAIALDPTFSQIEVAYYRAYRRGGCKSYESELQTARSGYHFTFCGVFRPVFIGQWVCKRFRALPLKYFLKNWESYDLLPESETGNSTAVEQVEGWNLEKGPSIIQHLCKESI